MQQSGTASGACRTAGAAAMASQLNRQLRECARTTVQCLTFQPVQHSGALAESAAVDACACPHQLAPSYHLVVHWGLLGGAALAVSGHAARRLHRGIVLLGREVRCGTEWGAGLHRCSPTASHTATSQGRGPTNSQPGTPAAAAPGPPTARAGCGPAVASPRLATWAEQRWGVGEAGAVLMMVRGWEQHDHHSRAARQRSWHARCITWPPQRLHY